ncbi:MAG: hypothetical protein WCF36_14465 [Candidatus Nanopelagicales bacterium]
MDWPSPSARRMGTAPPTSWSLRPDSRLARGLSGATGTTGADTENGRHWSTSTPGA